MTLLLPGLVHEEQVYCCRGCLPVGERSGALLAPVERSVETARAIHVAAPRDEIDRFITTIEYLPLYEQKLEQLRVTAAIPDGSMACATADGHWAGLPFHIELHFRPLGGGGYKSTLCGPGPIAGLRGGFVIEEAGDGCSVTHFENYEFRGGVLGSWIGRVLRPYIRLTMDRELRMLKRLVEDPAYLGEVLRLRRPHRAAVDDRIPIWTPAHRPAPHPAR